MSMKGHNWGECRKCGRIHKHSTGKITGQLLKNIQEANRRPERIRKQKEEWQRRKENGYESPLKHKSLEEILGKERADKRKKNHSEKMTGKHWKLSGQALKNQQEANRKKARKIFKYKNKIFKSNQELLGYKFLETLNRLFVYQYRVGKTKTNNSAIDFGFLNPMTKKLELAWEHHPENRWWKDTPENRKIYEKERRKLLDNNGYVDVPLIVTYDLSEESKNDIRELMGVR